MHNKNLTTSISTIHMHTPSLCIAISTKLPLSQNDPDTAPPLSPANTRVNKKSTQPGQNPRPGRKVSRCQWPTAGESTGKRGVRGKDAPAPPRKPRHMDRPDRENRARDLEIPSRDLQVQVRVRRSHPAISVLARRWRHRLLCRVGSGGRGEGQWTRIMKMGGVEGFSGGEGWMTLGVEGEGPFLEMSSAREDGMVPKCLFGCRLCGGACRLFEPDLGRGKELLMVKAFKVDLYRNGICSWVVGMMRFEWFSVFILFDLGEIH